MSRGKQLLCVWLARVYEVSLSASESESHDDGMTTRRLRWVALSAEMKPSLRIGLAIAAVM